MDEIILLKLGELVLKGLNRRSFEERFISNLRSRLDLIGRFKVYCAQSTVYVEPLESVDLDEAAEACAHVFGAVSVCRAAVCPKEEIEIAKIAIDYLREAMSGAKSFKVESKRADKTFHLDSIKLSQYVGGELADAYPDTMADMHAPELVIRVEIRDFSAFVHAAGLPGAGGMPLGINGKAVALLSGGIDSPVALHMLAKRGVEPVAVHFHSPPYTSPMALDKVIELGKISCQYCGILDLRVVPFTEIQEKIREKCNSDLFTIIMRRFMMRLAEKIALGTGCNAIITGESLGQVASQTIEAMTVTQEVCTLPVLRPVICLDKEEIVAIARRIGTFETSIQPFEDCCTVFTPRHPKTKPRLSDVESAEKALDVLGLVERAYAATEKYRLSL